MTRFFTMLGLVVFTALPLLSQPFVLELRPGPSTGADAMLFNRDGFRDVNLGNTSSFQISEWRASGLPTEQHQMMKFDLTALPENAVIETASLSLFFDPNNNDVPRFGHYGDVPTDFYLQRVTSEWDEATVTWNNRPSIDTIGHVLVPGHDSITQNYPDIDVTELVRMMHEGENYGFYLQMASSDLFQILRSLLPATISIGNYTQNSPSLIIPANVEPSGSRQRRARTQALGRELPTIYNSQVHT